MRVWNADFQVAFYHKQMTAARIGAVKSATAKFLYKFSPRDTFGHADISGGYQRAAVCPNVKSGYWFTVLDFQKQPTFQDFLQFSPAIFKIARVRPDAAQPGDFSEICPVFE